MGISQRLRPKWHTGRWARCGGALGGAVASGQAWRAWLAWLRALGQRLWALARVCGLGLVGALGAPTAWAALAGAAAPPALAAPPAACIVKADLARQPLAACTQAQPGEMPLLQDWTQPLPAWPLRRERLRLEVQADAPLARILTLGVPDAQVLEVWQRQGPGEGPGAWQPLLRHGPATVFAERPEPAPVWVLPLTLTPGAHELELRYRIHLGGRLQASLQSHDAFHAQRLRADMGAGLVAGILLTLLGVIVVYQGVARQSAYLAYAGLTLGQLLLLLQLGGHAHALFWPQAPVWNQHAPAVLGSFVLACHALFAAGLFQLRLRHRRWHALHLGLVGLAGLNLLPWGGPERMVLSSLALALLYLPVGLLTAGLALRERLPGAPLYSLGLVALALFNCLLFFLGVVGHNPLPEVDFFVYPQIGLLLETGLFSAALLGRIRQFQAQQAEARQRRLADAQALIQAEEAKRAAQAQAAHKSLQLASASHDIAQPLASLRLVVHALRGRAGSEPVAQHLDRTLDHAQALLRDLIERERKEHRQPAEVLLLGELLGQLVQENQAQAHAQGIRLGWVDSQVEVLASPLILGRVLRNLLSNALRYAPRGRVLLGVRRRQGGVEVQVLDTGPGLAPAQIASLLRPFEQGQAGVPEGHGLGLFIVRSLCEQSGWQWRIRSEPGRGSCFAVWLPPQDVLTH